MTNLAPEAATQVPELEHKTSPTGTAQALNVTPEGLVTAVVSVTGVVDEVNDLLEGGCYKDTLTRRKPKVIRNHDWNHRVGRTVAIEEYLPGDPRLPKETKEGKPWPKEAGALVATMQYNLGTDRGRNAFEDIKFYAESGEAEFSIGYKVPQGGARRRADGVRQVKKLDLWEISDVLFGAAPLTMALSLKDGKAAGETGETSETAQPEDEEITKAPGITPDDQPADSQPADSQPADSQPAEPDPVGPLAEPAPAEPAPVEPAPGTAEVSPPPAAAAAATEPANADPAPVDPPTPPAPDPAPAEPATPEEPAEPQLTDEQVAELHAAAMSQIDWDEIAAAAIATAEQLGARTNPEAPDEITPQDEQVTEPGDLAQPTVSDTPAEAPQQAPADHAELTPAQVAEGLALLAEAGSLVGTEVKRAFSKAERDKAAKRGTAMEDGSFPIKNMADLKNAIKAYGRAKDKAAAKKHIIARAKALNLAWALPKDWREGKDALTVFAETQAERLAELESKAGGADRNRGNAEQLRRWYLSGEGAAKIRWGTKGDMQRCVRIASDHMTREQAWGFCNLRHHEATGMWPAQHAARERKAVQFAADGVLKAWTPTAEVGPQAAHLRHVHTTATKAADRLNGSLEERREKVRNAVSDALVGPADADGKHAWDRVHLLGTWEDRVIARREAWDEGGRTRAEVFEIGYGFDQVGRLTLGTPSPVDLDVDVMPTVDATVYTALDEATAGLKSLLEADLEVKEGRVLSRVNLKRLQAAMTALLAVLAAAGVEVIEPTRKEVEDERRAYRDTEPLTPPDTTSDGARDGHVGRYATKGAPGEGVITPAELAAGLALLAEL